MSLQNNLVSDCRNTYICSTDSCGHQLWSLVVVTSGKHADISKTETVVIESNISGV